MKPIHILRLAALGLTLGGSACATTGPACQQEISDCLERCEASNPDTSPAKSSLPPQRIMTECELRCGCRRPGRPRPKPAGKPTPTGTAP